MVYLMPDPSADEIHRLHSWIMIRWILSRASIAEITILLNVSLLSWSNYFEM